MTEAKIQLHIDNTFEGALKCQSGATGQTAWMYFSRGTDIIVHILFEPGFRTPGFEKALSRRYQVELHWTNAHSVFFRCLHVYH